MIVPAAIVIGGALFYWISSSRAKSTTGFAGMIPLGSPNPRAPRVVAGRRASEVLDMLEDLPPHMRASAMRSVVFGDPSLLRESAEDAREQGFGEIAEVLDERAEALDLV